LDTDASAAAARNKLIYNYGVMIAY
jgi:hypothetical protein